MLTQTNDTCADCGALLAAPVAAARHDLNRPYRIEFAALETAIAAEVRAADVAEGVAPTTLLGYAVARLLDHSPAALVGAITHTLQCPGESSWP